MFSNSVQGIPRLDDIRPGECLGCYYKGNEELLGLLKGTVFRILSKGHALITFLKDFSYYEDSGEDKDVRTIISAPDVTDLSHIESPLNANIFLSRLEDEVSRRNENGQQGIMVCIDMAYIPDAIVSRESFKNFCQALLLSKVMNRCMILCLYDHKSTPGEIIEASLQIHPAVIEEGLILENSLYVPMQAAGYEPLKVNPGCMYLEVLKQHAKAIKDIYSYIVSDDTGPVGVRGIAWDVTKEFDSQKVITKSEEKYQGILDEMEDAYVETDLKGRIVFLNPASCRAIGYSLEEATGLYFRQFCARDDVARLIEYYGEIYRTGNPGKPIRFKLIQRDGVSFRFFEMVTSLIIDKGGIPTGFRGVGRDNTERIKTEEALSKSENRFRLITENITDSIWLADLNLKPIYISPSLERERGYTLEEIQNVPLEKTFAPGSLEQAMEIISREFTPERLACKGQSISATGEFELYRKDGSKLWMELTQKLIRDHDGNPLYFMGFGQNITEGMKSEKALRKSEEKYRSILEEMLDYYTELDLFGNLTFANPAIQKISGYSYEEELLGMNYRKFCIPEEHEKLKQYYSEIFITGKPGKPIIWNIINKYGDIIPSEQIVSLMRDNRGNPIGFRSLGRNLTERIKAEQALRESEEKYRSILENMEDIYCEMDLRGKCSFVNASACRAAGCTREEMLALNFINITVPHQTDQIQQYYAEIFKTGQPGKPIVWEAVGNNKEIGLYEIVASLMRDSSGKPIGFSGLGRDITERCKAEEELRMAEAKYRSIFDNAVEGIFQIKPDNTFLSANNSMANMLGYDSPSELLADGTDKSYDRFISSHDISKLRRGMAMTGSISDYEMKIIRRDGSTFFASLSCHSIEGSDGNLLYYEGSAIDITGRIMKEKAEREREAAEADTKAKGKFLASMSHEIRTPMNGVIGMIGLLSETELNPEQRDYAETIKNSAESLLSVINDILDFSKIEAGKLDLESIDLNLRTVMEGVVDILAFRAYEKGLHLACIIDPDVPTRVIGDPTRIRQIITNLLGNAIKFTHRGEILLHVTLKEDQDDKALIHFSVKDTGVGIPGDKIGMLFKAFTQVDTSTMRKYGGTGLGLSICRLLAEMMGGSIGAESKEGEGSTFWCSIPFTKKHDSDDFIDAEADMVGTRVLIVDGNATVRRSVSSLLNSWKCCSEEAANTEDAVKKLMTGAAVGNPFRIAVIDSMIPETGGEALAKRIIEDPVFSDMAIIMMTPMGRQADRAISGHSDRINVVAKPVKQSSLFNLIMSIIGRPLTKEVPLEAAADACPVVMKSSVKILLAEDNWVNQKVACKILEKMGYEADVVETGSHVIKRLEKTPYDLVFMDIEMPEMDGIEATCVIRDKDSSVLNHDIYIIAMTAHVMKQDLDRCLEAGMNDYITKPIQTKKLKEAIEKSNAYLKDLPCKKDKK